MIFKSFIRFLSALLATTAPLLNPIGAMAQANLGEFTLPASCNLDFSYTLQKPAGKKGFLKVSPEGKFQWGDGSRARFWGINVASTRLNIPPSQIDAVVKNFAKAGLNLVRLEAADNRNCLLGAADGADSRHFDPQYLDRLDYWMHALRKNGICYYLDLLDFRTFRPGDGVINAEQLDRAARPYAVFDKKLIELQKEYATNLLTHRNPYSGLRPIDDPAFAMMEICNEHGFFLYPEKLETLVEPYRTNLLGMWNQWLRDTYGTRDKLKAWWGQWQGTMTLLPEEDPFLSTVKLPLLSPPKKNMEKLDVLRSPTRTRDGVRFLYLVQQNYFKEMYAHLRAIGAKIPITAVVSNEILPDLLSVANTCDFLAGNWYGEVERFDSRTPGVRYYNNRNPLRIDSATSLAPFTAALRWNKKPVVIREFATSSPNYWRGTSVPEMLAYASLQDYDAVLLFAYQTNRAPNGMQANELNDYAFQADPVVWGTYAVAGQAFLTKAIRPAKTAVTVTLPEEYLFGGLTRAGNLYRASWSHRVKSAFSPPINMMDYLSPGDRSKEEAQLANYLTGKQAKLPVRAGAVYDGDWVSDTGEIRRTTREGRLTISTSRLRVISGEFLPNRVYDLGGGIRFTTPTPIATLMLYSLDGRPVQTSQHLWVKMVSRAENTGQQLAPSPENSIAEFMLKAPGSAPVQTYGKPSKQAAMLWLNANQKGEKCAIAIWMQDGTWEVVLQRGKATVWCDTPGIAGKAFGSKFETNEESQEVAFKEAPAAPNAPRKTETMN